MRGTTAPRPWRIAAALVVLLPLASGVARAEAETGPGRPPPITVTTLHGPNGEPLETPSPLSERPARALNERGQVVATIGSDLAGRGEVVLWDRGVATRISPQDVIAHPTDISDRGQVVGDKANTGGADWPDPTASRPFSWQDGVWRWLPVPDGMHGSARAVNNRGQVLGHLEAYGDQGTEVTVVAWSGGQIIEAPLDIGPGRVQVETVDINDRGQALFNAFEDTPSGGEGGAYVWEVGGEVTRIEDAEAVAINNRGQVTGRVIAGDHNEAFLWEDGEMTTFGTLGGPWSRATAINDRGQVVGISRNEADDDNEAFLWEDGEMIDLGTFGGFGATALDINNRGQVVGEVGAPPGTEIPEVRAFVWQNGRMTDLGALLEPAPPDAQMRISRGVDVNDRGQVVGSVIHLVDGPAFTEGTVLWTVPRRR